MLLVCMIHDVGMFGIIWLHALGIMLLVCLSLMHLIATRSLNEQAHKCWLWYKRSSVAVMVGRLYSGIRLCWYMVVVVYGYG